jgi:putative thioredoxin
MSPPDGCDEAKALLRRPAAPAGKEQEPAVVAALAALHLAEQPRTSGSLRLLEQAVAANPDDHQARFDLAIALSAKEDRNGAADQLLEIISPRPQMERRGGAQTIVAAVRGRGLMDPASAPRGRKLSAVWF